MKVLVIGSGGREFAVTAKLLQSKVIDKLYVLPGNDGFPKEVIRVNILAQDLDSIVDFCVNNLIDYVVVTPDDQLAQGLVDRLKAVGIASFGPSKLAATIESSKVYAKQFMEKYSIPTSRYAIFNNFGKALEYLSTTTYPTVIKADGLALGKGVIIAQNFKEATVGLAQIMQEKRFGSSGDKVVIEEFLEGVEVSVLTFTDGQTLVPMISSMDHKKALEGDTGLNTGGMGAIAPNPYYTSDIERQCYEQIFMPTIRGLVQENRRFTGCLYFGLMLTKSGPKVIEYNCRFGDPEAQVVLPLLTSDLLTIMLSTTFGTLDKVKVEFSNKASCAIILASCGYPSSYQKGYPISIDKQVLPYVIFAGVAKKDGQLVTNGGRVLNIIAVEDNLKDAISLAYSRVKKVNFTNMFYRKDIGSKALETQKR
ncbi:MAG: phosphoribosylamine--glycine ligase [Clostridia bacterium]